MHNIKTNFDIFLDIAKSIFSLELNADGNFYNYKNKPKMPDIQLITLSITAEALSIDSENLLFSKLKNDFAADFPNLVHRVNYNRRRKSLCSFISMLSERVSEIIDNHKDCFIIDSMPIPICKNPRILRSKICKDDPSMLPSRGFHASSKSYFYGFKANLITSKSGVPVCIALTSANCHDSKFLKTENLLQFNDCQLIGDKGYISSNAQLSLFDDLKIELITPHRVNMDQSKSIWSKTNAYVRKRIETKFSQLDDHFMIKRNYAKTTDGLITRFVTKISAIALLQLINHRTNKPLNQIKHALAA